eukprot:TRINITY_DN1945_c0_g1_i2.p1 TRINITY_DN1945_c0_g1~~TRINITY_DN1945_c0_g1_i2.p1  ORF type:complete len:297 (-),score=54.70 TRINITY_DN1945_c0_g1_i2:18-908(-)
MIRRPPRSTLSSSSAASDVYKRQANSSDDGNSTFWATFAALTTSFAALSFVLKEKAFNAYTRQHAARLSYEGPHPPSSSPSASSGTISADHAPYLAVGDEETAQHVEVLEELPAELSIFLVGFVVATVALLTCVPIAFANQAITTSDPLWPSFRDGMKCLTECEHAAAAYGVYAAINVCFNVCLLLLTSKSSALLAFLSLKMSVPLVAVLSPVSWPVIGSHSVAAGQWGALVIVIVGVASFRIFNLHREKMQNTTSQRHMVPKLDSGEHELVQGHEQQEEEIVAKVCCWPLLNRRN